MPAFILLIIIGAIVLWFLCSFLYKPIGRLVGAIIRDVQESIKDEDFKNQEKKEI